MIYRQRPRAATPLHDDDGSHTAEQVIVGDDGVPTGLLDVLGRPIYRYRDPVGFRLEARRITEP